MLGLPPAAMDTHAHIFEPTLMAVADARYVPEYAAQLDKYLDVLTAHGIDRGVLVQPSFLGSDNSYLLSALAAAPERLRGVIVVSPGEVSSELSDERVECLNKAGIRGVRLNLIGQALPDLFAPVWQAAASTMAKHGWHLELQACGQQWVQLASAIRAWPGKVVIDHLGLPQREYPAAIQCVLELALFKHVWVKISGPYRSSRQQAEMMFAELLQRGCSDRLVFGSDWPFTRHEEHTFTGLLTWAHTLAGDDLFRNVMTTNPAFLFGWPAPSAHEVSEPILHS